MIIRIVLILILNLAQHIFAIETITISQGHTEPIPIAVNHFLSDNSNDNIAGNKIITVINNDLKHCGLFRLISTAAFIENQKGVEHKPLFATWRQINSNLLLNGEVKEIGDNKLKVSFVLWDTILEKNIVSEVFEVPSQLWRRVAHKIADKIYEKTTGDKGYFDTKIAYVSETGNALKRIKRIAIMDQDGENHKYITDGKDLVLTPRFSSDNSKLLYISYARKIPRVYMYDLKTNKNKIIGDFVGMSFAPRFAHKEQKAVMSIARNGSTHIFEIDLRTMRMKQLTFGPSINTSPSYSPDDSKIVFNSDRSGSRQIYIMDSDGTNATRISFSGIANTSPNWSPRGDYIAFTKVSRNEGFSIAVMRPTANPEENGERIIANGYLVESPTWASNGRVIMFAKTNRPAGKNPTKTRIYSIDLTGYNEQIIHTPKDASDPEWSNSL